MTNAVTSSREGHKKLKKSPFWLALDVRLFCFRVRLWGTQGNKNLIKWATGAKTQRKNYDFHYAEWYSAKGSAFVSDDVND